MAENPGTTMPAVNTDLMRSEFADRDDDCAASVRVLCDAVDTLRRQFAGQSVYINSLERKLNEAV